MKITYNTAQHTQLAISNTNTARTAFNSVIQHSATIISGFFTLINKTTTLNNSPYTPKSFFPNPKTFFQP